MLKIAEQSHRSDTGRQRTANEDSFFARAPLFVVADGMGGAQAGEVASKIAAESFEPIEIDDNAPPERFLREIVEDANSRIHNIAEHDASRSGMGTTLTAALVRGDEISFAHVGDSRAYLFRDGELRLLTSDHSLVEELRRQGRLTDAQAEDHPQRSIITRALGPEPEVEVDTMTYRAKPGDVYLLCSDGLTTMVKEPRIAALAAEAADLDELTGRLIDAANEAGGRDNITVVAFKLTDAAVPAEVAEGATLVGPAAAEAGAAVAAGRPRGRVAEPHRARAEPESQPLAKTPSRRRRALTWTIGLLIVAGAITGGVLGVRQVYFIGTDDGGRVALYRGLPYDLPLDVHLYGKVYSVPALAASVPANRRDSVTNHELRGRSDAVSLLNDLRSAANTAAATTRTTTKKKRSANAKAAKRQ